MNTKYVIEVISSTFPNGTFVVEADSEEQATWSCKTIEEARVHKKYCKENYGWDSNAVYKICKVEEVE